MANKNDIIKYGAGQKGVILIFALLALGILTFLAAYFVSFSIDELKIAASFSVSQQAYYLAEAGVQEAIYKLKNDPVFKSQFEALPTIEDPLCSSWSLPLLQRNGGLFDNGSYEVAILNNGCGQAEIIATSSITNPNGSFAKRVVKARIFKAMGNPVANYGIFTGGASENISIQAVNPLRIYQGDVFANNNVVIKFWSNVFVEGKLLANGNINLQSFSQLTATSCSANECDADCVPLDDCPPQEIAMPPVDFESSNPGSFLSKAQASNCSLIRNDGKTNCLFTPQEFAVVLWSHYPKLSLPTSTTIFVSGDIEVMAGQELQVNGVLAASRDIKIGNSFCWTFSQAPFLRCGLSALAVNRPGGLYSNEPSGVFAKRKLQTGTWLTLTGKAIFVEGLLLASDELSFDSSLAQFEIYGAVMGRKIGFSSLWGGVDIYLESDVITDTLGVAEYSPIITIDHWEEEY